MISCGRLFIPIALLLLMVGSSAPAAAQTVTTGSLSGQVVDPQGGVLPGTTVVATHVPTGTKYETTTGGDGRFQIVNARVGAGYEVTVSLGGFRTETIPNVAVGLGEDKTVNVTLELASVTEAVTVVAEAAAIDATRAGTASNVRTELIQNLPTISRGISDFARLDPNITTTAQGQGTTVITIAGRNNRYNNIQIDGAINNDLFAISDASTPGQNAGTEPISLDAIEQLQVVVSPYDVRQGGFTGGAINAVTKSGANDLHATAYYFGRDESLVGGISDRGNEIALGPFSDKQGGVSVGGKLVQNKAFFFGNAEFTRKNTPSGFSIGDSGQDWGHRDEAQRFVDILRNQYGYDPGLGEDPFREFVRTTNNNKVFVRTDFNLSNKHRLTVRHNFIDAQNDQGFPTNSIYYFPDNFYRNNNQQNSTVGQLNSTFGSSFNELRITYQRIRDKRNGETEFPFVRVFLPDGTSMRAGTENFSSRNALDQDIIEITDDFTKVVGRHTLTIGTHNELFKFDNLFIRDNFGNYTFSSIPGGPTGLDLLEQGLAQSYDYSFSATSNPLQSAKFKARQFGFYAGDQWRAHSRLTLTYGVRVDLPVFPDRPTRNEFSETTFGYRTDVVPEAQLWSPRAGFNYSLREEGREQIRGGIGIFAGRTPYVWLSNQYGNTGLEFTRVQISSNNANRIPFVADPNNQPQSIAGVRILGNEIDVIDPDYDFPSLWRGNVAYDRELPFWGLVGSAELLFSKTINDVKYQNLNLRQTGVRFDGRPAYDTSAGGRITTAISNAILLTDTDEGDQWNLSFKLERPFRRSWYASGSYSYGRSRSLMDGGNSQASSQWGNQRLGGDVNNPTLALSNFDVNHRVTLAATYTHTLPRNFDVTASMFYNGQAGRPYSITYNNTDFNGDGQTFNDLMFIPVNLSDLVINNGNRAATAAEVAQLEAFIEADDCLRESRGVVTERNCGRLPFTNIMDAKFAVGLPIRRAKVEVTMDILNFLNLLNSEWGRYEFLDFQTLNMLAYRNIDAATGKPIYDIATITSPTFRKFTIDNLRSRWQAQFGFRVRF